MKFVALGAVYEKDNPDYLDQALHSLSNQTKAVDTCLVVDGPITPLHEIVISKHQDTLKKVIRISKNQGLSHALNTACKELLGAYDYVIRFDADDINETRRFETTINFVELHQPDLFCMSIREFDNCAYRRDRITKIDRPQLNNFMFRNLVFHPASAFRLKTLSELGFYEHVPSFEDWATWLKFLRHRKTVFLCNEVGVEFRVSDKMIKRRFGWEYFKKEVNFVKHRLSKNYFPLHGELIFIAMRALRNLFGFRLFQVIFRARS